MPLHGRPAAGPARSRSVRLKLFKLRKLAAHSLLPISQAQCGDLLFLAWRVSAPGPGASLLPLCSADERAHLDGTLWHSTYLSRLRSPPALLNMRARPHRYG